jgi:hypothetical protein
MPLLQSVLPNDVAPRRPTSGVPAGVLAMAAHASTASKDELAALDTATPSCCSPKNVVTQLCWDGLVW